MRPSGAHVHGADPVEVAGALAILAAVGAVIAFIAAFIWVILGVVVVAVAALVYAGWRMHRKYGRAPEVLPWVQRQALPARQVAPIAARRVEALPAPPQIQINNFYVTTPEQAAELAARREITEEPHGRIGQ